MSLLEADALKRCTPCRFQNTDEIAHALAEVHLELVLIHPFRDGNGRIARATAQWAVCPPSIVNVWPVANEDMGEHR